MSRSKSLPLSAHVVLGRSLQSSCSGLAGFNSSTLLQVCTSPLHSPHPLLLFTPALTPHLVVTAMLVVVTFFANHMGELHSTCVVALRLLFQWFVCPSDHPVV